MNKQSFYAILEEIRAFAAKTGDEKVMEIPSFLDAFFHTCLEGEMHVADNMSRCAHAGLIVKLQEENVEFDTLMKQIGIPLGEAWAIGIKLEEKKWVSPSANEPQDSSLRKNEFCNASVLARIAQIKKDREKKAG